MAEKEGGEREKEHRRTEIETHDLKFEALEVGDGDDYALLFHGFPDDPRSFLPLMERLAEEGYTAVAPYMRGYGATDRPPLTPSNYSVTKLGSDVLAVSSALGADDPLILGHDWGATAVTAVSRLDPTSASNCVTMSVPPDILSAFDEHPSQTLRSWYMALFQIPGVSEEVLRRDDFAMVERLYRMWSPGWTDGREERVEEVKETLREGETVEASLLYYRSFFEEFLSKPSDALEVRGIDVPTLLLTGKNDGCISPELFGNSERCYDARFEFERINGAGHFVHAEKPDEVADRVLEFVGRK